MNRIATLAVVLALLLPELSFAADVSLAGHLKYQPGVQFFKDDSVFSSLGPDVTHQHEIDARLNAEYTLDSWDALVAVESLSVGGSGIEAQQQFVDLNPFARDRDILLNDDRRLFDLTLEVVDEDDFVSVLRLDRASVGYTGEQLAVRLGRQVVSWGNTLIFSVLDVFNPFSPTEIDKDYKTGDDTFYAQWLFDWGADLQTVVIPRRVPDGSLASDQSSFAGKFHHRIDSLELDFDLVAARHFDENLFGGGISMSLLGGVLRSDVSVTELRSGSNSVSFDANFDRSFLLFEKNLYGYVEYFRSGVGVGDGEYNSISQDALDRLGRGELFVLGRDYLAAGTKLEMHPLLNWFTSTIFNLHDESGVIQQRFEYDASEDCLVTWGANIPYGPRSSEFGGILLPSSDPTAAPLFLSQGVSAYLRLSYYF